tara:strand:+ start:3278 stop:6271 length:2994 start_codon:yes stop_codon:yes gene_type:complete
MATTLSSTTFLTQYNDDYRDSDHYHRILFNNGRALQARELTQSQTIIQKEIERLAKFVVNEGAIFNNNGTLASGSDAFSYTYIKVTSLPGGYNALIGTSINNGDLYATVKAVIPDVSQDVLMVRMDLGKTGGSTPGTDTSTPKAFQPADVLSTTLGNITIENLSDAVGNGSLVDMPAFDTYAAGHLIHVEPQTLILDKYSTTPTKTVGFKVTEDIVTTSDNIALYDNSGSTPNLTSPGADRLRIILTLTTKDALAASDTFYEIYKIINGQIINAPKSSDKLLGNIASIINARTEAITGDFVEFKPGGTFGVTIDEDSASADFISVKVSSGTAFVKGNKITRDNTIPFRVRKPNDPTVPENLTTVSNEFVGVSYGNYFLTSGDSTFGLVNLLDSYGSVGLYDGRKFDGPSTGSANPIGTARVRNIDKYGDNFRIHVFDVAMDSNGAGVVYNLSNTRSIGNDSANQAILTPVSGQYDLYDRDQNNLLFNMPRKKVREASTLSMKVLKKISGNKTGNTVTISAGSNTFADVEQWVYAVDSSGAITTAPTITSGGAGSSSATLSGMPNGTFKVLTYQNVTAVRKTKTLTPDPATGNYEVDSSITLNGGAFNTSKTDIYQFHQVIDDQTNEDITYKFTFEDGQRDNYYGPGKGKLKPGVTAPGGTINVKYRYFAHSVPGGTDPGYFDPLSYTNITYDKIPIFTSQIGTQMRLSDVIDMRPSKNASNGTFSSGTARVEPLPRNGDTITVGTAKYWNARLDCISMAPNGLLTYNYGTAATRPRMANNIDQTDLLLHKIRLEPYVLNKLDLTINSQELRGYKMADLRRLENRIGTLERVYTLTAGELNLAKLEVYDPDNQSNIRQTEGLTGDNFQDNLQSDWTSDDYRAHLHRMPPYMNIMSPKVYKRAVGFTYDSDLSLNTTVLKGSTVWPVYSEAVADYSQQLATSIENVNQFETPQHVASGLVIPEGDYFTVRKKVDQNYSSTSNNALIVPGTNEVISYEQN